MKQVTRFPRIVATAVALFAWGLSNAAPIVIDFEAVALRGANAGGSMPTATEFANGNGASIDSPLAGQKSYYGTSHFDGQALSAMSSITFKYRPTGGSAPYVNLSVTNGTYFGIVAPMDLATVDNGNGTFTATYTLTGNLNFYEPAADDATHFNQGPALTFGDLAGWSLVTGDRPLSPLESGVARGPVEHSLAILWGDSQANYLGEKDIFDVAIFVGNEEFRAGNVPEPGSMALVALALTGLAAARRRRTT